MSYEQISILIAFVFLNWLCTLFSTIALIYVVKIFDNHDKIVTRRLNNIERLIRK